MKRSIWFLCWIAALAGGLSEARASGSVTLVTSPSWGIVVAPNTGTTNYWLSATTGLVTVTSGSGLSLGGSVFGTYLLAGSPLENISWSVGISSFSGSGVSVVAAYGNGTASSGSATLSILGASTLTVGGVLGVSAGAQGIQTATVTVTVNFL